MFTFDITSFFAYASFNVELVCLSHCIKEGLKEQNRPTRLGREERACQALTDLSYLLAFTYIAHLLHHLNQPISTLNIRAGPLITH